MALPTDSLFSKQWHLLNKTKGEYDLNITSVWDDYTGKGVKVMVMDNGFDYLHPDLAPNYDTANDYDYGSGDDDAAPIAGEEIHGTAVIGIIGAARNGTGVVGVAYGATLIGARVDYNLEDQEWTSRYVAALDDAIADSLDIVNMSFGSSNVLVSDSYNAQMKAALEKAVDEGRDGLGLALVKSAGNNRSSSHNVGNDERDGDTHQIIVAAVDRNGFVSHYSNFGTALLVSAFGSPSPGQIVTTDRLGADGYYEGDFNTTFNGTSAATPMVSGIVALMLEANDSLGWRDIQSILAYSARHSGSAINGESMSGREFNLWGWNGAANWNGGALHYSADYGFGLVDARAAVRLAETWTAQSTSANEQNAQIDLLNAATAIAGGVSEGQSFSANMTAGLSVERVRVTVDFDTPYTFYIEMYLVGPDGREYNLINREGGTGFDGVFTFESQAFRGESSDGEWSVRIVNGNETNTLTVSDIKVEVFGSTAGKDNTYYYTNEFSEFLDTHSKTLSDASGVDTINASAVTSSTTINLATGTGKIDGVAVKVSGIENVFAGDGKDVLTGSNGDNQLLGGRGADILTGGQGKDEFIYVNIADSSPVKNAFDVIRDFARGDIINLEGIDAIADLLDVNDAFTFIGAKAFGTAAGQLRFELDDRKGSKNDVTHVEADVTGDGDADFLIELVGLHVLKAADFVL